LSIVGVAGNITRPSRTSALLSDLLAEVCALLNAQSRLIELVDVGPHLFQPFVRERLQSFSFERLPHEARSAIQTIETADALIVATPVYKGSYTGALKHLFDLVRPNALTGKPVLLAATGGSPLHGLVTEHQLRPLFGFFNALTLPTSIFALEGDFQDYRIDKPELTARIKRAAVEFADLLEMRSARRSPQVAFATA
ncbi:MAG: NAD(P)H-dependent oxidoreductase, partial [Xanthobacteraceae bacterium]